MPNFLGGALKWGGRTHFLAKILPGSELSECCSNNALYVHNAFPLQMFSASMGHFSRFLMYILIHSRVFRKTTFFELRSAFYIYGAIG